MLGTVLVLKQWICDGELSHCATSHGPTCESSLCPRHDVYIAYQTSHLVATTLAGQLWWCHGASVQ